MARGHRGRGRLLNFPNNGGDSRGRGRGDFGGSRGRGRGGRGGVGPSYINEFDLPIQQWPNNNLPSASTSRGYGPPRSRGRGRGSYIGPSNVYTNPRRGLGSPRGRGRGRADESTASSSPYGRGRNLSSKLKAGAPLSKLLYEDRPLLKPVKFVRSVFTATLFQKVEEIFQPIVETAVEGDEQSHIPTADAVFRVFHPLDQSARASEAEDGEELLEEIDFTDVGRMQAQVDAAGAKQSAASSQMTAVQEPTGFFVDTTPANIVHTQQPIRCQVQRLEDVLGGDSTIDDDEEVIVYVAPHPRNGKSSTPRQEVSVSTQLSSSTSILTGVQIGSVRPPALSERELSQPMAVDNSQPGLTIEMGTLYPEPPLTSSTPPPTGSTPELEQPRPLPTFEPLVSVPPVSVPEPPTFESVSFAFDRTSVKKQARRLHPVGTPRSLLKRNRKPRRKSLRRFGAFGAMHEEAMLRESDPRRDEQRRDEQRRDEQRRGDSDVNWGTSDEDDGVVELSVDFGGMEMDEDISLDAMKSFVKGMSAEGSRHITMDDIADIERMRSEDEVLGFRDPESADEDEDGSKTVGKIAGLVRNVSEERVSGDDSKDEEDESHEDEEDEEDVRAAKQLRIGKADADDGTTDEAGNHLEDEENAEEESSDEDETPRRDFQARLERLRAQSMMQQRGKDKHVPPELREQWERDRQKKAENKQKRALDRMLLAADPSAVHKGGKKGRKAMLAAARAVDDLPNRVIDFITLEQQIRRFLADIGGRDTMVLPPAGKATRKHIHELATAFNLKSQSKGKGEGRFTTLVKTTRSGIGINEPKIRRIMKQATNGNWEAPSGGKGRGKAVSLAKHREGEEVGKGAAKIDGKNIGFRMLAAMGWSNGDRIGLSGGLDVPLTAIMKKTKLGLGATL